MSSLKLKCVTGFGDKVSPVSEILKSQGWPVPPRPPHFGRLWLINGYSSCLFSGIKAGMFVGQVLGRDVAECGGVPAA